MSTRFKKKKGEIMKIRDFLRNDEFDVNTNVKIFDGTDKTWEEAELLYRGFGHSADVPDDILDMDIKYITTDGDCIVIEVSTARKIGCLIVPRRFSLSSFGKNMDMGVQFFK